MGRCELGHIHRRRPGAAHLDGGHDVPNAPRSTRRSSTCWALRTQLDAVGLAIKTGDSNANARDWGFVNGNYGRAVILLLFARPQQGANPVSGGDVGLLSTRTANVAMKTSTGYEALTVNGNICGVADNTKTCGTATFRWSVVYAGTGTINTSDEREKRDIEDPSDAEIRAISRVLGQIRKYRWKDAMKKRAMGRASTSVSLRRKCSRRLRLKVSTLDATLCSAKTCMWEYERNVG
jgi:hypothetical protein